MQRAHTQTWGQLKRLILKGEEMVRRQDLTLTPDKLFLVMLAIVAIQVGIVQGEAYWTFHPNPPVLHTVTWGDESVPGACY